MLRHVNRAGSLIPWWIHEYSDVLTIESFLGDVEKIQFALIVATSCQNSHKNAWRKKWIFVINVFCKSCSGLNIAAGMRRPLPQMHCHRYPPAKLNKSKRKERHVLFAYFCFGFIGAKNKDVCLFCVNVYSLNHKTTWHIFHNNRNIFSVFRRIDARNLWDDANQFVAFVDQGRVGYGLQVKFLVSGKSQCEQIWRKNSGQISVASKGDRFVKA